jgi:hypothetical protein
VDFDFFEFLDNHMTRLRFKPGTDNSHYYPSEASVQFRDRHGDLTTEGGCLRASYFRVVGGFEKVATSAYSEWIFKMGKLIEEEIVLQAKEVGIWVDNNIRFYDKEYNISGEIDLLIAEPPTGVIVPYECCTPDSLFLSHDYRLYPFKSIPSRFNKNSFRTTHSINSKGDMCKIKNVQIKNYSGKIYRFRGKYDGLWGQFTENHPILTAEIKCSRLKRNDKRRTYSFLNTKWKDAKNIKIGDYICIPKVLFSYNRKYYDFRELVKDWHLNFEYKEVEGDYRVYSKYKNQYKNVGFPIFIEIDKDLVWLLGLYIAEGSASNGVVSFSLHENEIEIIERLQEIINKKFGLKAFVRKLKNYSTGELSKGVNVDINSSAFVRFIKAIIPGNTKDGTKHIWYDLVNPTYLWDMLRGIWDGDGCLSGNAKTIKKITTAVPHLAFFYFQLAAYCHQHPTLNKDKQDSEFNSEYIYSVSWSENDKYNNKKLVDCEKFWASQVREIDKEDYIGEVYNVEVDTDNTYTVGGIITHNCKSCYGYMTEREIFGNKKIKGAPKLSQMIQLLVYLWKFRDQFPYGRMAYFFRDTTKRKTFKISLLEQGELIYPVVDGEVYRHFTVNDILKRYKQLDSYIKRQEVPPGDYELQYSPAKIEDFFKKGKVGKTKYEAWKKDKLKPWEYIGDWKCAWCGYRRECYPDIVDQPNKNSL